MTLTRLFALLLFLVCGFQEFKIGPPQSAFAQKLEFEIAVTALRDIGPVTRMDGSGLIVRVDVYSPLRQRLPDNIQITDAWAHSSTDSWHMSRSEDQSNSYYFDGTGQIFVFRQGPVWPIGTEVTVSLGLLIESVHYPIQDITTKVVKNS